MKSNPNLVFLLAARRTGGTALAKAFKEQGFRLIYDPLNPALSNLKQAVGVNSEAWHSKHPIGLNYFEELGTIDASFLPKDLIRANTKHIGETDPQYGEISNYFRQIVNTTSDGIKTCFKIEQVGVYELLRSEFPDATFIGITRSTEAIIESYLNLYLTSQNTSFFQRDLDYFFANSYVETGADAPQSSERYIEAVHYVSQKHSALVGEICQSQVAIVANSASVEVKPGYEPDEQILHILNMFSEQVPSVKFGFEPELILENTGRLVSERDALVSEREALVSERDALMSSRSWRLMSFLRRLVGLSEMGPRSSA